jgi:hypothetical protein
MHFLHFSKKKFSPQKANSLCYLSAISNVKMSPISSPIPLQKHYHSVTGFAMMTIGKEPLQISFFSTID